MTAGESHCAVLVLTVNNSWAFATANCCFTSLINWSRWVAVKLPSGAPDKSMFIWCDKNYRRAKFEVRCTWSSVNEKKKQMVWAKCAEWQSFQKYSLQKEKHSISFTSNESFHFDFTTKTCIATQLLFNSRSSDEILEICMTFSSAYRKQFQRISSTIDNIDEVHKLFQAIVVIFLFEYFNGKMIRNIYAPSMWNTNDLTSNENERKTFWQMTDVTLTAQIVWYKLSQVVCSTTHTSVAAISFIATTKWPSLNRLSETNLNRPCCWFLFNTLNTK